MIEVEIPLRVGSRDNEHRHWRVRAKRVKAERHATAVAVRVGIAEATVANRAKVFLRGSPYPHTVVTLARIAPRQLDTDGLSSALKSVRDQVATELGVSDAPGSGVEWRYAQERGRPRQYAVRVRIERAE